MFTGQRQDALFSRVAGAALKAGRVSDMIGDDTPEGGSEFERRTRALLLQSADQLPGAVRSRLTQARHAALAARSQRGPFITRRWMPLGAAVAAGIAVLIV